MNPGAPDNAHMCVVLQHVQHEFGSVEIIGYRLSLVLPDAAVNRSAGSVLRHSHIGCARTTD